MKKTFGETDFENFREDKKVPEDKVGSDYEDFETFPSWKKKVEGKFNQIDWLIWGVLIVVIIMLAGIIIDTLIFHIQENRTNYQIEQMLINK